MGENSVYTRKLLEVPKSRIVFLCTSGCKNPDVGRTKSSIMQTIAYLLNGSNRVRLVLTAHRDSEHSLMNIRIEGIANRWRNFVQVMLGKNLDN